MHLGSAGVDGGACCAARKAGERISLRAEAQRKRRAMQRKVLYTNPLVPEAGNEVDVYYNPDMTDLRGRPEVYFRGSWNRWTHPTGIPVTRMEPAFSSGIGFLRVRARAALRAVLCAVLSALFGYAGDPRGMHSVAPLAYAVRAVRAVAASCCAAAAPKM